MFATTLSLQDKVDELLRAAPAVFAALTPKGADMQDYLGSIIRRTNNDLHIYAPHEELSIANSAVTSEAYLAFIQAHPELQSFRVLSPDFDSRGEILEETRLESIRRKYPELRNQSEEGNIHFIARPSNTFAALSSGLWNPLELLILTKGDLSFYSGLDKGLDGSDMFLYMEHGGRFSNGEVFVGVRPYGERKGRVKEHLAKLPHGALIAFYEVAQATVNGYKVGVVETMQSDLLRQDRTGINLVPNKERRPYTSGENHWLLHTLPQLERALVEAGARMMLIASKERVSGRNVGTLFANSGSVDELYRKPEDLGYRLQTLDVDFLRREGVKDTFWVKPLT